MRASVTVAAALVVAVAVASPAHARDRIRVVGSSTVYPFAAAVAESFGRSGRWRTPIVESTGTGAGFKAFCRGLGPSTPDVNDASRPMTDAERYECARNGVGPLVVVRFGSDGILIAAGRANGAFDLTREQLYRAVAKTVPIGDRLVANPYRRWRDIAPTLPDRPIRVYGPAPNHGTRDAFGALVMLPVCERQPVARRLAPDVRAQVCLAIRGDGAWIDVSADYSTLLARLLREPDAVGVLTFEYLVQNRDRIVAARIDGVAPDAASIGSWRYPLARPLFLYVKRGHLGTVPGLGEFVREFLSERAAGEDGYLVERGLSPLPGPWLAYERRKAETLSLAQR